MVLFPGDGPQPYLAELSLPARCLSLGAEELQVALAIVVVGYQSGAPGRRALHHTAGVYRIELPVEDRYLAAARAGQRCVFPALVGGRHHVGWTAD